MVTVLSVAGYQCIKVCECVSLCGMTYVAKCVNVYF